jgi:hypothetical protein
MSDESKCCSIQQAGTSALPTHHSSKIYKHFSSSSNSSAQERPVSSLRREVQIQAGHRKLQRNDRCALPIFLLRIATVFPSSMPNCFSCYVCPLSSACRAASCLQSVVRLPRYSELTEGVVRQQPETVLGLAKGLCSCSCEGST